MSTVEHRARAPQSVRCFVITVSDTRTEDTDTSGRAIVELLTAAGHVLEGRRILKDDPAAVAALVREQAATDHVDAIITTGGTGISRRDSTFEAIDGLLDKRLPGFGELFRMLSFQEIGTAAMLSRACAGTHQGTIVIALPGSENAARLAVTRLLIPELGHLVAETRR
ncbi:MAG: MogA/MoaB family molybdenum cofactor biosynthesis protein [Acidobacteriota bacterium]|nr:MogA/MoaB family molybdenum cofactor biosynthesis protein [Acidobacteriota bacterium]